MSAVTYSLDHHRWLQDLHQRLLTGEAEEVEKRLRMHLAAVAWEQGRIYPDPKEAE